MSFARRYWKLGTVGATCALLGAGASVIATAGAATTAAAKGAKAHKAGALSARTALRRSVHGELVVHTKTGFATVTYDRGFVQSVSGQQLTIREGTKTVTYKTVTLTIPAGAHIRDNGKKVGGLGDVKIGQRVTVFEGPQNTLVVARNVKA